MSDLRTAAQQALEALYEADTFHCNLPDQRARRLAAMAALRAALAQQAEPRNQCGETCERAKLCATCARAMPQQAEPLNLRDPAVQKRLATQWGYVPAAQAEPVEPVAWAFRHSDGTYHDPSVTEHSAGMVPLYPPPPQRKPLTEEEIYRIHKDLCNTVGGSYKTMARAVEAAHGIKE